MPSKVVRLSGRIQHILNEGPRVKRFFITVPEKLSFSAGQSVALSIPNLCDARGPIKRMFSIVSIPEKTELEFCIAITPPPSFSSSIAELPVGSEVIIEGPFGIFTLKESKPLLTSAFEVSKTANEFHVQPQLQALQLPSFIAAGTGIAPIMCMIRTLACEGKKGLHLLYGFRTTEDFLYKEELEKYAAANVIFLTTSASRLENTHIKENIKPAESTTPSIAKIGRITQYLNTIKNIGQQVYICGPPEMVKDTVAELLETGFTKEQITREQW